MNHAEGSLEALIQKSLDCNKLNNPKNKRKAESKKQTGVVKKASVEGKGGNQNAKIDFVFTSILLGFCKITAGNVNCDWLS